MTATLTRAELDAHLARLSPEARARMSRTGLALNESSGLPEQKAETVAQKAKRFRSKWEERYHAHLAALQRAGRVDWFAYEAIRLRLAITTSNGRQRTAWFTPDFAVCTDLLELHEVKGFWREAARLRVKVVAEKYPVLPLHIIQYRGGEFVTVEVFNA
jgi:Protein of unknown function (DUF1064)